MTEELRVIVGGEQQQRHQGVDRRQREPHQAVELDQDQPLAGIVVVDPQGLADQVGCGDEEDGAQRERFVGDVEREVLPRDALENVIANDGDSDRVIAPPADEALTLSLGFAHNTKTATYALGGALVFNGDAKVNDVN